MKPPLDFERAKLEKIKLSILIDNPLPERIGEGKESYVGYVHNFNDNFLVLITPDNTRIMQIAVRWSMILSIWVYVKE